MDKIREAMRSQSLVDSMHELIESQQDVVSTLGCTGSRDSPSRVMLPVTGVAFMLGTIIGGSVMVGLGDDYYVERTPRQTQTILERRTLDLKRNATAVAAKGTLIAPHRVTDAQQKKQRAKEPPAVSWKKGFLSTRKVRSSVRHSPRDPTKKNNESARGHYSGSPPEANSNKTVFKDSLAQEDPPTQEMEEAPIMDIREWLDDSGRRISVDVTDLGKVLREPQGVATEVASSRQSMSTGIDSHVKGSDLDKIFDRLEEEESKAEEAGKASDQLLGPSLKKGFLHDAVLGRPASRPEGSTTSQRNVETWRATKDDSAVQSSTEPNHQPVSGAQAFRDSVIEKPVTTGTFTENYRSAGLPRQPTGAPSRVSRFKAGRQGLQ